MNAFLNFDNFITPKFISVLYWILLAVIVLSGLSFMFTSRLGFAGFLIGLVIILLGALFTRIYCELLMVVFSMNNHLKKINEKTDI